MRTGLARSATLALAATIAGGGSALAITATERTTRVASPPPENGAPANASSDNLTFSGDERKARKMAFDSLASNLVPGDTNGVSDVFVVHRGSRLGKLDGRVERLSARTGRSGAEANGESRNPSLGGDTRRPSRCVVFESRATNLDRRDTSPDWDVYVRRGNRTTLVSPGRRDAHNGVVDGRCETVTFESRGRVYARDLKRNVTLSIGRGGNPDQQTNGKGVAYERGSQVYHRRFERVTRRTRSGRRIKQLSRRGRELLVSASRSGRRGNGTSANPSADDNGYYVAFDSTATSLCTRTCRGVSGDRNGRTRDVFRRTISRRAPTRDRMQMVSYSYPVRAQGNGDSHSPAMSGAGENVVFVSEATNLRESRGIKARTTDPNGTQPDVFYWNFPRGRKTGAVSRESRTNEDRGTGQPWPAPVGTPAISNKANYIGWTSAAGVAGSQSAPGVADIFVRFLGGR
ncbi:MAG: hypothetical protein WD844_06160 [Thermoleophilaceae bacterium]